MHDRSGSQRMLMLTASANKKAGCTLPAFFMTATPADKTAWPSEAEKIIVASLLVIESLVKLSLVVWKIVCNNKIFHR